MDLSPAAGMLLNHLTGAVQRALRMANDVTVEHDGSLASTLLAAIVARQSDVPVTLIHLAAADRSPARTLARRLGADLVEVPRAPDPGLDSLGALVGEARRLGPRLIVASGAPPKFGGPNRSGETEQVTAKAAKVELRAPYRDARVSHLDPESSYQAIPQLLASFKLDPSDVSDRTKTTI